MVVGQQSFILPGQHEANAEGPQHATNLPSVTGCRQNPYALFRFCCANLYTKDHAQLCGVVSFSLFLCLVVISLMHLGAFSIFYIVIGVIVYSLLMKSLFGYAEKVYVLFYLLFEAIQIGFYLALILYFSLPLIFFSLPGQQCCQLFVHFCPNGGGTFEENKMCKQIVAEECMELLLFVILLVSVKLYFARVFAHYYKMLIWNERMQIHCAQYRNGRGVQIAAFGHVFPPPPPSFWDNHIVRDTEYGYDQQQHRNDGFHLSNFAELPSYAQAIGQPKQKVPTPKVEEEQQPAPPSGNGQTNANANELRVNLHV